MTDIFNEWMANDKSDEKTQPPDADDCSDDDAGEGSRCTYQWIG